MSARDTIANDLSIDEPALAHTCAILSLSCMILACLAACAVASPAQSGRAVPPVIEVPFELVHGAIVIQVFVNGHGPFSMMLDTGADPSMIQLETAKEIGLKVAAAGSQGSGGGTDVNLARETTFPLLKIGGLTATHVDALAMDLSHIGTTMGHPIDGVLGYSLLKNRIVQIDYPARKVRFYQHAPPDIRSTPANGATRTTLRFRYKDDILASRVTVNGKPVATNIDTGSNSYFQINPSAVDKLDLSEDVARAHPTSSVGFNGTLSNREGKVKNVSMGTLSIDDPAVVFFGKGMGVDEEPWDLRIGSAFLKDYVVTLDFVHGRITLAQP